MSRARRAALLGGALALLWETVLVVDPASVAVVFRLGAVHRTQGAGLGFRLPRPLESDLRVQTKEVRRLALERRRTLTGDHNLIDLALVLQYAVKDAAAFATNTASAEDVASAEVSAAATQVVGSMAVDDLLTVGRTDMQQRIQALAQRTLDGLGAGLHVVAIEARELVPPAPVVDSFNDVSSARGDRETIALAASAYASKRIPDVRGQAARAREEARADAARTAATARARSDRFTSLLPEARRSREALMARLHRDTLARVAPRLDLRVVPPGTWVVVPAPAGPGAASARPVPSASPAARSPRTP